LDIALIPPASLGYMLAGRPYQMMLPAPLTLHTYHDLYIEVGLRSTYLMLDNGAWEGNRVPNIDLVRIGRRFRATELVTPDILNDPGRTRLETVNFIDWFRTQFEQTGWHPNFMAVAHGHTEHDAREFVRRVADDLPMVTTIGIGRAYARACGDKSARAHLAQWIANTYPTRFKTHLLGYNDEWPDEVLICSQWVRSLDTIAPFTAAWKGLLLRARPAGVPRPHDYFYLEENQFDLGLVKANIQWLDEQAAI
jgi:hypothetical protein